MILENTDEKIAISIKNISVIYDQNIALNNVSIDIKEGDYLGIIGPNGGGKTTFLKSILGLINIDSGEISIYGKKPCNTGRLIAYVPQVANFDKKFPITVFEVVLTGRLKSKFILFHKYSEEDKVKTEQALKKVGIFNLKDRMISDLSGGEFQRMLIARALCVEPKILLLDEPTASVDVKSREQIFNLLKEINNDITIILVSHDLLAVSSYVKTLACINQTLTYHGDTQINEKIVSSMYGCPIDLIAHGVPHRVLKEHKEGEKV
jgi:zinc transport system ATP-binding protein